MVDDLLVLLDVCCTLTPHPKHTNIVFQPTDAVEVSIFLHDIRRVIMGNRSVIDTAPLQVYISVLLFSPTRSIVRNQFNNEEPKWVIRKPTIADKWSVYLQTLEGHSDSVNSVAWSHDATRLASASSDKTIKIWDPATG
jgi:WD40 repeat protein